MNQSTIRLEDLPCHRFTALAPDTRLDEALTQLDADGLTVAVVLQDRSAVGLFGQRERLRAQQQQAAPQTPVGTLMHTQPLTLNTQTPIAEASRQLLEHAGNELLVVDDQGAPLGLLRIDDLLTPSYMACSSNASASAASPARLTTASLFSASDSPTSPSSSSDDPSHNVTPTDVTTTDARSQERQIKLLSQFATALINLPADRTDAAINRALQGMGELARVDRTYIFRYDFDASIAINTHEWCADGISPQLDNLQAVPLQDVPDWVNTHLRHECLLVDDVDALPPCYLRDILIPQDIKSLVCLPIIIEQRCIGFLGLDAVRTRRRYTEKDLEVLGLFARTLANYHQRAQTEQKLANSEANFQAFFDKTRDLLFVLSHDGEIIQCNEQAAKRLDYTVDELQGKPIVQLHPVELHRDVRNAIAGLIKGTLETHTLPLSDRNGVRIPIQANGVAGQWNGRPALFVACHDLSDIKASEEKFSKAFHLSAMPMMLSDMAGGTILEVNEAFHRILGHDTQECIGQSVMSIGMLQVPERWRAMALELEQHGQVQNLEIPLLSRERQTVHGLLSAAVLELQGRKVMLTQILDITARKAAEDALEDERIQLRTLFSSLPQLVWLKDPEGAYLACNRQFEELFGRAESEIVGRTDYELVSKEAAVQFRRNDRMAIEHGKPRVIEETLSFASSGYSGLFETIKTPIFNANQKLIGVLGIARDITQTRQQESERQRVERQMHQSSKMEALGQLTGGVAHEFNNMLAIIIGYRDLLEARLGPEAEPSVQTCLDHIDVAGTRARELVRQLLSFSRPGEKRRRRLNLVTEVRNAMILSESSLPSSIEIDYQPSLRLPDVLLDAGELQQMLTNLLVNARDAMSGQGRIDVGLDQVFIEAEECQACHSRIEGHWIELSVADTGPGIHPDQLQRIFEPFYTTKEVGKGTGLGLSIVQSAVEHNGGHILLDSRLGEGCRFRLLFPPLREESVIVSPKPQPDPVPTVKSARILVVDDEPALTDYLRDALSMHGLQVVAFNDSRKALDTLLDDDNRFDLLITDQTMPGLLGTDLVLQARARHKSLRVILCTGHSDQVHKGNAGEFGIDRLLRKPVTLQHMLGTINELLSPT